MSLFLLRTLPTLSLQIQTQTMQALLPLHTQPKAQFVERLIERFRKVLIHTNVHFSRYNSSQHVVT